MPQEKEKKNPIDKVDEEITENKQPAQKKKRERRAKSDNADQMTIIPKTELEPIEEKPDDAPGIPLEAAPTEDDKSEEPEQAPATSVKDETEDIPEAQGAENPVDDAPITDAQEKKSEEKVTEKTDTEALIEEKPTQNEDGDEPADNAEMGDDEVSAPDAKAEENHDFVAAPKPINVEHFSDYTPKSERRSFIEGESVCYENMTILDDDEVPVVSREEQAILDYVSPKKPPKPEDPDEAPYSEKKPRRIDMRFDLLELFVFTLAVVMILTTFVFKHSVVKGSSMENTLHEGEHLIISDLFYTPEKQDIIVCEDFSKGTDYAIVKRVIATEGDTIEILHDGTVIVNGEELIEKYVFRDGPDLFPGMSEVTVPDGYIFVMGDHRNNSDDSRKFGFIREDAVLGRVLLRIYPMSDGKFGTVE